MSTASENSAGSSLTFRLRDHATSKGVGDFNEDQSGHAHGVVWMFDGSTDMPETYRPWLDRSGAYWIAQIGNDWLLSRADPTRTADPMDLMGELASTVETALAASGMAAGALPPVTALGIAALDGNALNLALVGDVFIYHPASSSLLSDPRFGTNEKAAIARRRSEAQSTEDAQRGISERRRGYLRGLGGQWVLGPNPGVSSGAINAHWTVSTGDLLLLATDGFARAVTDYSIASDWDALTDMVVTQGAGKVMASIRAFEDASHEGGDFFKKSDDVCVALYEIA